MRPVERQRSRVTLVAAFLSLAAVPGCVSSPERQPIRFLSFDLEDLDSMLVDTGVYHRVLLVFEINPETDLPPGSEGVIPRLRPEIHPFGEVYRPLEIHEVVYAGGVFEAGGERYTPQKDARISRLFVFKRRHGDFEFRYRTQPIIVRATGSWIPTFYYSVVTGGGVRPGQAASWQLETLQVGRTTIQADSRKRHWLLNGQPFQPSPEKPLVITRRSVTSN
jgi:hypothetical protein